MTRREPARLMPRYLVVANQTLGHPQLTEAILACTDEGPSDFYLLAPATLTQPHSAARLTRAEADALAQRRLDLAVGRLEKLGVQVSAEIGDPSPMLAIAEVLSRRSFDQLIISTLAPGPSQWLRRGLPERVERLFHLPVTLVTARAPVATAGRPS